MSIQNILLGSDTSNQGTFDAQLHSLQIYKTPTLSTDTVNLAYLNTAIPPWNTYFRTDSGATVNISQPGCYVFSGNNLTLTLPVINASLVGREFMFIDTTFPGTNQVGFQNISYYKLGIDAIGTTTLITQYAPTIFRACGSPTFYFWANYAE